MIIFFNDFESGFFSNLQKSKIKQSNFYFTIKLLIKQANSRIVVLTLFGLLVFTPSIFYALHETISVSSHFELPTTYTN